MTSEFEPASPAPPANPGEQAPEAYFRELGQTFARTAARAGTRDFTLNFDGILIRLRFVGDVLPARLLPTLAHLQVPETSAVDYTICCWDDQAAGSTLPALEPWMRRSLAYDSLPVLSDARFLTFYVSWFPILSAIDLQARTAYCCYANAGRLLMYEVSGPLRGIFNAILNQRGMQIVHASAVGTPEGSVLLAGAPYSGKSTLAMLALRDGLSYQSDDLCVLTAEERPRSLCLYNIAKLRDDMRPRFPTLHTALTSFEENGERKSFFYVQQQFPGQVMKSAPVRALVLPRIVDQPASELARASNVDAVRGLIKHTIREVPMAPANGQRILLQALSRLPVWHLAVGRDDAHTLTLIRNLLA